MGASAAVLATTLSALGQTTHGNPAANFPDCGYRESSARPPVIGHQDDKWPDTIEVVGRITGLVPGYCGYFCLAGQLRLEVTESRWYPPGQLYAFAYCVEPSDVDEYCGKLVRVVARKSDRSIGLCGIPEECFDSKGRPFYVINSFHEDVKLTDEQQERWTRNMCTELSEPR